MKRFSGFSHGFFSPMYYTQRMSYRTIKIDWLPQSGTQWKTFTAARLEAGRLWSWLVERHATARQQGGKWPTKAELQKDIKRQFPDLHSQSAQQIVADFCEAIASAESLRKRGEAYEYPHKKPRYRQVIFTNQGAKVRNRVLSLPCGKAGRLSVRIPKGVALPGRLREVRLDYGCVEIVCEISAAPRSGDAILGIDLGVNTLIAATDGKKAVLISGREIKATITSLLPVLRWRKLTLRRPARYAESGRSIVVPIAADVDSWPPVMWWVVRISALSASTVLCDRVVAYRTLSTGNILPSILRLRLQVVLRTPAKSLGLSPEKPPGFSPSGVSPTSRRREVV